ncbi:hypothetical protein GIB67_008986 [Kingdonia uniflora]|uniref:No apical meristem-associated C-terminal domain-containing protein n=1 Tax=Kingdonia uniflora TaxID=39325 RepID=A0A7J7LVZ5_9MAGN|nr:hypothetical protein GIB67_008986 [Kingdonia uniflora]
MCGVQGTQERFRNNSRKVEEDRENDAHKIYKCLNGGNDFKHHETYKILAREPQWANLRDDGLNHAVNVPRNIARRPLGNSSPGNSVGSNNLSEDPDDPPTPQSADPNSDLDGLLYEGGSSDIQIMLDELLLEKIQAKEEKERRRAEAMQHWQTKMDLEQAKEDRKVMEKDLSNVSRHQL